MDLETYQQGWDLALPLMQQKLAQITAALHAKGLITDTQQLGDEEWRLESVVRREDTILGAFEFTLHEDDEEGADRFAISCLWHDTDGPRGGWTPYFYTDAYSAPIHEIIQRIEAWIPDELIELALSEIELGDCARA